MVNDNALAMATTARSVLGADLLLTGDNVTIEHLLAHRLGIGDYLALLSCRRGGHRAIVGLSDRFCLQPGSEDS